MLSKISNSEVYTRFLIAFRRHNEKCPEFTVQRTCKTTGRVTEITRRRGEIPQSVKGTFHNILAEYVKSYVITAVNMPDSNLHTDANPPSLHTNSVYMGNLCDCSDRTVRNHLRRLRDLGVVRTKFHGRTHNYELWISPEFLYGGEGDTTFKKLDSSRKTNFPSIDAKIFPANNFHRELFEKEKGSADMLIKHGEDYHREGDQTEPGTLPPSTDLAENTEKLQAGGAAAERKSEIVAQAEEKRLLNASKALEGRLLKGPRNLDPKFLNMLIEFWFYAWEVLYPGKEFTKEQQEKSLAAIMDGVYNNFRDERSDKDWVDFQVHQLAKLDKAHKYYDHHPEQWAPDPYAFAVAGKGYFDAANLKGFVSIDGWIQKELMQKALNRAARANGIIERDLEKENKCREVLRKARVDIERERAGLKLRKETLGKNIIGIFQHYHTILRAMGAKYADKLSEQFTDQKARDFAPPKYDKAKRIRKSLVKKSVVKLPVDPTPATVTYIESWMEDDGEGYYVFED